MFHHWSEQTHRGEIDHQNGEGDGPAIQGDGRADSSHAPQAGRRRESSHISLVLEYSPSTNEAHACDQALESPGHHGGLPRGEMTGQKYEGACAHGDDGKGAESEIALRHLTLPADGDGEEQGKQQFRRFQPPFDVWLGDLS